MPHHVRVDGTGPRPWVSTAGLPPAVFDDRSGAPGGLPVRTPHRIPPGPPGGEPTPERDRFEEFAEAVLGLHRVLTDRFIPMCSCGLPARHCAIVKAEHDVLGIAMPFEFGPLARPHYFEV